MSYLTAVIVSCYSLFKQVVGFADACDKRVQNLLLERRMSFASVGMEEEKGMGEEKPFDFFRILFGMLRKLL